MLVVNNSVRKLETQDVIPVKAISLQSVDDDGGLQCGFEISETEHHFLTRLLFPWNKAHSFIALERPEDVRHFTLCRVKRDPFHIHCVCGILRDR